MDSETLAQIQAIAKSINPVQKNIGKSGKVVIINEGGCCAIKSNNPSVQVIKKS